MLRAKETSDHLLLSFIYLNNRKYLKIKNYELLNETAMTKEISIETIRNEAWGVENVR